VSTLRASLNNDATSTLDRRLHELGRLADLVRAVNTASGDDATGTGV
jgi:hypothetical protein